MNWTAMWERLTAFWRSKRSEQLKRLHDLLVFLPTWQELRIALLLAGATVLCLLLLGACVANPPAAPVIRQCRVPQGPLQPTAEPPMQDKTNQELVNEANQLREALRLCNADKKDILDFTKRREK